MLCKLQLRCTSIAHEVRRCSVKMGKAAGLKSAKGLQHLSNVFRCLWSQVLNMYNKMIDCWKFMATSSYLVWPRWRTQVDLDFAPKRRARFRKICMTSTWRGLKVSTSHLCSLAQGISRHHKSQIITNHHLKRPLSESTSWVQGLLSHGTKKQLTNGGPDGLRPAWPFRKAFLSKNLLWQCSKVVETAQLEQVQTK